MNRHSLIIQALRQRHQEEPLISTSVFDEYDDQGLVRLFFKNFRGTIDSEPRGLRLTDEAFEVFKLYFTHYVIDLEENFEIKSYHLLYLDRNTKMPWHLNPRRLVLFEKQLSMKIKISGSLDTASKFLK